MADIATLRGHFLYLAGKFDVNVLEGRVPLLQTHIVTSIPRLKVEKLERTLHICNIDTEEAYAAGMHELGHVRHPSGMIRMVTSHPLNVNGTTLIEEESAWRWAQENAIEWTPRMAELKRQVMEGYSTRERINRPPTYQSVSSFFKKVREP